MFDILTPLAQTIKDNGGRVILVGGAVRNSLMGRNDFHDLDVEVFGLAEATLEALLPTFGETKRVGRSFPVWKVRLSADTEIDVALPRAERKTGTGHSDFAITFDPQMSFKNASGRRNLTVNAIGIDVLTGEVLDCWGGRDDIASRTLRAPTEDFMDDALRVLIAMQQAGRFEMVMEPTTVDMCRAIRHEFPTISLERVWGEWWKWASQSIKPSMGLDVLSETGWLEWFPELAVLKGIPQDVEWHPEGWLLRSLGVVACNSDMASTTHTVGGHNLFSGEIGTHTTANDTGVVSIGRTTATQSVMNLTSMCFPETPIAWPDGDASTTEFCKAVIAQPMPLIWSSSVAPSANECFRVVFQVQLSRMNAVVQASVNDGEVFKGIVTPVAVYVVNMLLSGQFPSDVRLHDNAMKPGFTPTGKGYIRVSSLTCDLSSLAVNNCVITVDLAFLDNVTHESLLIPIVDDVHCSTDFRTLQVQVGDVWQHTKHVVDAAAMIAIRDGLSELDRGRLVLAALCHDLGKATHTQVREDGRITAYGHPQAGEAPTRSFLARTGAPESLVGEIVPLVREHMAHVGFFTPTISAPAVRKLAIRLEPATMVMLMGVIEADISGRPPLPGGLPERAQQILDLSRDEGVMRGKQKAILMGRHLLDAGMVSPGPIIGEIMKAAYEAQVAGAFRDLDGAMEWARAWLAQR